MREQRYVIRECDVVAYPDKEAVVRADKAILLLAESFADSEPSFFERFDRQITVQ